LRGVWTRCSRHAGHTATARESDSEFGAVDCTSARRAAKLTSHAHAFDCCHIRCVCSSKFDTQLAPVAVVVKLTALYAVKSTSHALHVRCCRSCAGDPYTLHRAGSGFRLQTCGGRARAEQAGPVCAGEHVVRLHPRPNSCGAWVGLPCSSPSQTCSTSLTGVVGACPTVGPLACSGYGTRSDTHSRTVHAPFTRRTPSVVRFFGAARSA
jgi:hypothetical protein